MPESNVKQLLEKRGELKKEIRDHAELAYTGADGKPLERNKPRDYTAEEEQKWDRLNKEYDANEKAIERAKRLDDLDRDQRDDGDDEEELRGSHDEDREERDENDR